MYRVNLSEHPEAVNALWDGQPVSVIGIDCYFYSAGDKLGYIATATLAMMEEFDHQMKRYLNGEFGFTKMPVLTDFNRCVRMNTSHVCILARSELEQLLRSGGFYIG